MRSWVGVGALLAGVLPALAANGPAVGSPAADFSLSDSRGQVYKLSDYRGKKKVVLEFFRSGSW